MSIVWAAAKESIIGHNQLMQ